MTFADITPTPDDEFAHAFSRATVAQQVFTKLVLAIACVRDPDCTAPESLKTEVLQSAFSAMRTAVYAEVADRLTAGHDGRDGVVMLDRVGKLVMYILRNYKDLDTFEKLAARVAETGPAT